MKTLYISDLDGTLLNHQAELSTYTVQTLNRLIDQGLYGRPCEVAVPPQHDRLPNEAKLVHDTWIVSEQNACGIGRIVRAVRPSAVPRSVDD